MVDRRAGCLGDLRGVVVAEVKRLFLLLFVVIITFDQHVVVTCPGAPPVWPLTVVRQSDGTYRRRLLVPEDSRRYVDAPICSEPRRWREEWTDLPERGGRFIREVEPRP